MKKICPIIQGDCLEHGCEFYTHLMGQNPQTGVQEDQWGCAIKWMPILLIENANQMRKTTASADKISNEVRGLRDNPIQIDMLRMVNSYQQQSEIEHKDGD